MLAAHQLLHAWERGLGQSPTGRALALLDAAEPGQACAQLPIGARDAALLRLRTQLFGEDVAALAHCPACRAPLDVAFKSADVSMPHTPDPGPHRLQVDGIDIAYRLPTSDDVLAVAQRDDAAQALLLRCVQADVPLSAQAAAALAQAIADADPQACIELALQCPDCGHGWNALFDIVTFLWSEVSALAHRLLRDVHTLARAYGWSEAEILGMSAQRRQCYLELAQS